MIIILKDNKKQLFNVFLRGIMIGAIYPSNAGYSIVINKTEIGCFLTLDIAENEVHNYINKKADS